MEAGRDATTHRVMSAIGNFCAIYCLSEAWMGSPCERFLHRMFTLVRDEKPLKVTPLTLTQCKRRQ